MLNLYLLLSYVSAVTCTNTLSMLLCLVVSYVAAGIWLIQHSLYYVGLLYILVYVGAIVVLFVYVIQLLDTLVTYNQFNVNLILGRIFTLSILLIVIMYGLSNINISSTIAYNNLLDNNYIQLSDISLAVTPLINTLQVLGQSLFSEYSFALILSAHAIVLAVIGPIKLALTTIPVNTNNNSNLDNYSL
jgi:NADH:ubiquinone oxidoreductase subunit 6 (subunit J)